LQVKGEMKPYKKLINYIVLKKVAY
jgi:hypothetical protein